MVGDIFGLFGWMADGWPDGWMDAWLVGRLTVSMVHGWAKYLCVFGQKNCDNHSKNGWINEDNTPAKIFDLNVIFSHSNIVK